MFNDPVEDIIKILYGPMEGKLYSIMKSKKKILESELKTNYQSDIKDIDIVLTILEKENFIQRTQKDIPIEQKQPKQKNRRIKDFEIKFNEKFDYNFFYQKYKFLKENLEQKFKQKENENYYCNKCKKSINENLASRTNFKCIECGNKYTKNEEDLTDLKIKSKKIFEILDDRFEKKLGNINIGKHSNYVNYLKAKYGNNIISDVNPNNQNIILKEEYDPYIESTLKDLDNKNTKPWVKNAFYELIEAFNKCKKK